MGLFSSLTRRRFVAGGAAATVALAASTALSGCGDEQDASSATGEPQVIEDSSQIVDVLSDFDEAECDLAAAATYSLPRGTVLFHSEGSWAAAMLTPESAVTPNTAGAVSLASGDVVTLVDAPTKGGSYSFFDVRLGTGAVAWVEIEYASRAWTLLAAPFSEGTMGSAVVELDSGDADWDPATFTVSGSEVIWQKMPSTTGTKTASSSICSIQDVAGGEAKQLWESPGRFATQPRVSDGVLTISPRVLEDQGTYYGITAIDISSGAYKQVDQLVLPASVRPFEAVRIGDRFAFSIEASYSSGGALGKMGTYLGREGGPYYYVSREPAACAAGKGSRVLVKTRSSHCVIDIDAETYAVLACPDRALDYGDYPASEGTCDRFVTYATVKNSQGMPDSVTARVFALA